MQSRLSSIIVLSILPSACGFEFNNPAEHGPQGAIRGQVVSSTRFAPSALVMADADDLEPVPGAACTLEGTDRSATTDDHGEFEIPGVADGSYILICKRMSLSGLPYAVLRVVELSEGAGIELGTLELTQPGAVEGRAVLSDLADHAGILVFIPGTSYEAHTDADGIYTIDDVPEGQYDLHFEKTGYLTVQLADIQVNAAETTIVGDAILALSTGPSGSISLAGGNRYWPQRGVEVSITATAEASLLQLSEDPNFVNGQWTQVMPSTIWTFDSDGTKRLYVKFSNLNGLASPPMSAEIIIDTTPPEVTGPSGVNEALRINGAVESTGSTSVTLTHLTTDASSEVAEMLVSNNPDFTHTTWEDFASEHAWELTAGDGQKTVYARYRDLLGHETSEPVLASILLDTQIPTQGSISINLDPFCGVLTPDTGYTACTNVTLNLSALGATEVRLSDDPTFAGGSYPGGFVSHSAPFDQTPIDLLGDDGTKTIYAKFLDGAGNESALVSDAIVLDTVMPIGPEILGNDLLTRESTYVMSLSQLSTDANFDTHLASNSLSEAADPGTAADVDPSALEFALQEGENYLTLWGKDLAGHVSEPAQLRVTLDTVLDVNCYNDTPGSTSVGVHIVSLEPATCTLDYGLSTAYGNRVSDIVVTGSEVLVQLTGLTPSATYHYKASCADEAGNTSESPDAEFMTP